MGYTHYFDNAELKRSVVQDMKKIVRKNVRALPIAGWDGTGDPVVNDNEVTFNGAGNDACETFSIKKGETVFNFCKTNRKEYDIVVVACLVSLIVHDAADVSSDGTYGEWGTDNRGEWENGIKLYEVLCGKLSDEDREKVKKAVES